MENVGGSSKTSAALSDTFKTSADQAQAGNVGSVAFVVAVPANVSDRSATHCAWRRRPLKFTTQSGNSSPSGFVSVSPCSARKIVATGYSVGTDVGVEEGASLGGVVGTPLGVDVVGLGTGAKVGSGCGASDGNGTGASVGDGTGAAVGSDVGTADGVCDGACVGTADGVCDGAGVGIHVGTVGS